MAAAEDLVERWLLDRRKGLGSSDAAGVCGVSKWASPLSIYAEKTDTGALPERDESWLEWGHRLEPVIADWYADLSGRIVDLWEPYTLVIHPERRWMRCTPDATQQDDERGEGLVELKAPLSWTAEEWEDGPPLAYQVQLQHQLEVTGYAWGTIVCLLPGERPRWWDFGRHEPLIAAMVRAEEQLWRCIETRTRPPADGAQATADALQRMHRKDDGTTVELPARVEEWHLRLEEVKADQKADRDERKELENLITSYMGDATYGVMPGVAGRYRWRAAKNSSKRTLTFLKR